MTVPKGLETVLKIDPNIMHGAVCFAGTRIPVTVFLDNLAEGMSMDEFLTDERAKYGPQIEAYAQVMADRAEDGQLRVGLYYPMLARLVWWAPEMAPT